MYRDRDLKLANQRLASTTYRLKRAVLEGKPTTALLEKLAREKEAFEALGGRTRDEKLKDG